MESHGPRGSPRRADGEGPRGPPGATAASRQEAAAAARTRGAARRLDLENTPKAGVTGPLYRVSGLQHPPRILGFLERLASRGKRTLGGFWSSPGATLAAPPTLAGARCDGGLLLQGASQPPASDTQPRLRKRLLCSQLRPGPQNKSKQDGPSRTTVSPLLGVQLGPHTSWDPQGPPRPLLPAEPAPHLAETFCPIFRTFGQRSIWKSSWFKPMINTAWNQ